VSLGGISFFCEGEDIPTTLLAAAAANGVDLLIVGKPRARGPISRLLGRQISTSLLRRAGALSLMFAAYPQGE
jgi:nucleotide-binding universal stress UspA family protein